MQRLNEEGRLKYEETDDQYVSTLENSIQRYLAKKIEEERRKNPQSKNHGHYMNWNRKVSHQIKKILLPLLEMYKCNIRMPNFEVNYFVPKKKV